MPRYLIVHESPTFNLLQCLPESDGRAVCASLLGWENLFLSSYILYSFFCIFLFSDLGISAVLQNDRGLVISELEGVAFARMFLKGSIKMAMLCVRLVMLYDDTQ